MTLREPSQRGDLHPCNNDGTTFVPSFQKQKMGEPSASPPLRLVQQGAEAVSLSLSLSLAASLSLSRCLSRLSLFFFSLSLAFL